ncbi:MAG: oligosaccharide flippase family protein [Cyanobacteria bacterium P01_D01_bin.105]
MTLKTRLLSGTIWITLAEALILPTGFLTLTFLTRQLGTEGYGLFALSATIVTWIEWGLNSVFSRTTIKFVSETEDKSEISTAVLRAQLGCGIIAALIVVVAAPAIASALNEPILSPLLRLFAIEIPLVNAAQAHQNILAGEGKFGARAMATAVRWTMRLLLIVGLVSAGFSIYGAILGSLAAMLADIVVCRFYTRPSLWERTTFPMRSLAGYAVPLFLAALSIRFYAKLDLIALKALGGTTEEAGIYAIAQNLALFGSVMSPALAPILISSVSKLLSQGELQRIKSLSRTAMRAVLLHLPFAALLASTASELVPVLFGQPFTAAAPMFALLLFATVSTVMIAVTSAILVASDRPEWTAYLSVPLPILAIVGHGLLIPDLGAMGAAITTLAVALAGAISGVTAVYARWQVLPSIATFVRCGVVSGLIMFLASLWATPNPWIFLKLSVLSIGVLLSLWGLGEANLEDKEMFRSLLSSIRSTSDKARKI